jgi:hypothetical protein
MPTHLPRRPHRFCFSLSPTLRLTLGKGTPGLTVVLCENRLFQTSWNIGSGANVSICDNSTTLGAFLRRAPVARLFAALMAKAVWILRYID